jgi:hypothetical protein
MKHKSLTEWDSHPDKKGLKDRPFLFGGEGEITRRFAPRPFGAALAGVISASLLSRSPDLGRAELMS